MLFWCGCVVVYQQGLHVDIKNMSRGIKNDWTSLCVLANTFLIDDWSGNNGGFWNGLVLWVHLEVIMAMSHFPAPGLPSWIMGKRGKKLSYLIYVLRHIFVSQDFCGVSCMLLYQIFILCTYILKFRFGSWTSIYPVNFLTLAIFFGPSSLAVFFV